MNTDPHFHFVVSQREVRPPRRRHGARRQRHPHRARAPVDLITERLESGKRHAALGRGADHLFHDQRARDPATAGGVGRFLDRDVVVGHHACNFPPGHLRGHGEIHHIAFVILDDEKHACAGVDGLRSLDHLVRRRRGEDLAGAGGIEHAAADKARMQRLMPRTAARNQGDLARF